MAAKMNAPMIPAAINRPKNTGTPSSFIVFTLFSNDYATNTRSMATIKT